MIEYKRLVSVYRAEGPDYRSSDQGLHQGKKQHGAKPKHDGRYPVHPANLDSFATAEQRGATCMQTPELPLRRSSHGLRSTAAFLVSAGFLVVWLPLDVHGFRLVLARGWHDQLHAQTADPLHARYARVIGWRRSPGSLPLRRLLRIGPFPAALWSAVVVSVATVPLPIIRLQVVPPASLGRRSPGESCSLYLSASSQSAGRPWHLTPSEQTSIHLLFVPVDVLHRMEIQ